jgi:hypothetical protein
VSDDGPSESGATYRRRIVRACIPLHNTYSLLGLRPLHLDTEHPSLLIVLPVLETQLVKLEFVFLGFGFSCHDPRDSKRLLQQGCEFISDIVAYLCLYISRL